MSHHSPSDTTPATRDLQSFATRDGYLQEFADAVASPSPDGGQVLAFVGSGVDGLSREMSRMLAGESAQAEHLGLLDDPDERSDVLWDRLDLRHPTHRHPAEALFDLRTRLASTEGFEFPAFDLAYAEYQAKANPTSFIDRSDVPGWAEESALADLVSYAAEKPGQGVLENGLAFIQERAEGDAKAYVREGMEALQGLVGLEPEAIAERLPGLWSRDVQQALAASDTRLVLFADAYEKLPAAANTPSDDAEETTWLHDWITALPGALWIVTGRELPKWIEERAAEEDAAMEVRIRRTDALSDSEVRQFLVREGIEDTEVQDDIVEATGGDPYRVDLAIDAIHHLRKEGRAIGDAVQAADTPNEMLFQHLRGEEVIAIKLLAVPRTWDRVLFEMLTEEFDPGLSPDDFETIRRFSFVMKVGDGMFRIRDSIRQVIHETAAPRDLEMVHHVLFEFYATTINSLKSHTVRLQDVRALEEALYHGQHSLARGELIAWFYEASDAFRELGATGRLAPMYRRLLDMQDEALDFEDVNVATTLGNLAGLYYEQGRYEAAASAYQRALDIFQAEEEASDRHVATTCSNLAHAYRRQEKYEQAETKYQKALDIRTDRADTDHFAVARVLNGLGVTYHQQEKYDEAESHYTRAMEIIESEYGPNHRFVAATVDGLAGVYYDQERYEEAESAYRRVIDILETIGGQDVREATAHGNLASVQVALEDYEAAESGYQRLLDLQEEIVGRAHPRRAQTHSNLAAVYKQQEQLDRAESHYEQALDIQEYALGPDHPDVATTLSRLADVCHQQDRYDEAEPLYRHALEIFKEEFGDTHPRVATTLNNLALLYANQQRYDAAKPLYVRTLEIRSETLGSDHPAVATTLSNLAGLYHDQGQYKEAHSLYERALSIREEAFGEEHNAVATTLGNLGTLYDEQGHYEDADACYERALEIYTENLGPAHPTTRAIRELRSSL